jgi:hypothetical protein
MTRAPRLDPSLRGGASRQPVMTAYRQQAIVCAAGMPKGGPRRVRELRPGAPDAGRILLRNVYGRFNRVSHGAYRATAAGQVALLRRPNEKLVITCGHPYFRFYRTGNCRA